MDTVPWFELDRPRSFCELTHGKRVNTILDRFSQSHEGIPHLFLYGPGGNGKYTRLLIFLKQLFQSKANPYQMRIRMVNEETGEFCNVDTKTNHRMMMVMTSSCHCVVDLSQPTIKKGLIPFLDMFCRSKNVGLNTCKFILFRHADRLDTDLQSALRKIVESYSKNVRFLVTSKSLTGWNHILLSRFLTLRLESPTPKEASAILKYVGKKHRVKMDRVDRKQMIDRARMGGAGTIHLRELLMILEIGKDYVPDRKNMVEKLVQTMKGTKEQMRNILELIYIHHIDDFVDMLTGDLVSRVLSLVQEEETKKRCIELAAKWDYDLRKDATPYVLMVAEAFYFSLAEVVGTRLFL